MIVLIHLKKDLRVFPYQQQLSILFLNWVLGKNYYLQIFSEECNYKIQEEEIRSLIEDGLKGSFDDDIEKEEKSE